MKIVKLTNGVLSNITAEELNEYKSSNQVFKLVDGFTAFVNIVTDDGPISIETTKGIIELSDDDKSFNRMNCVYLMDNEDLADIIEEFGSQPSYVGESDIDKYLEAGF